VEAVREAAVVQDWMVVEGGAERVALELADFLPAARLYTSFFDPRQFDSRLAVDRVRTWPLQRVFGPTRRFRSFLPFYPLYFGGLDLRGYELVVSSSVAFTHAVRTAPSAVHVSYVHTPIRYAWDLDTYLRGSTFSPPSRIGGRLLRPWLQRWDRSTAGRPDILIANSETVRQRIQRVWDRDAEVIYPPVDVDGITPSTVDDGYLLMAARMLAYRRLDIAIGAATRLGRELVVVGDGPERSRLQAMAGPSVRFLGRVDRPMLVDLMRRSHAYLVPGEEDFGIAPVEAMAAGKPVVALARGGATETVLDGRTGILFDSPTVDGMASAMAALDDTTFDRAAIRAQAERFAAGVFRSKLKAIFERAGVDPRLYGSK
jgi:glycosyltransferase involved in cell wall biosynthesis